jgi:hypothetical protein
MIQFNPNMKQARSEAYAKYIQLRSQDPDTAEKAYHSVVDSLGGNFIATLKVAIRNDETPARLQSAFD